LRIDWPTTRFSVANPPGTDRDVLLIRGIEPSMRWRTFCDELLELCHSLEVSRVVLLGALLADVPYTRPLPISGSASDRTTAEQDAEIAEYVRELEERSGDAGLQPLSGDEIAQEFEKYLRRRGGQAGPSATGPTGW